MGPAESTNAITQSNLMQSITVIISPDFTLLFVSSRPGLISARVKYRRIFGGGRTRTSKWCDPDGGKWAQLLSSFLILQPTTRPLHVTIVWLALFRSAGVVRLDRHLSATTDRHIQKEYYNQRYISWLSSKGSCTRCDFCIINCIKFHRAMRARGRCAWFHRNPI